MIAVVIINYRDTAVTLDCLASLYEHAGHPFHLVLVDNAGDDRSKEQLSAFLANRAQTELLVNTDNRGFAGACNQAITTVIDDPNLEAVALLNNDIVVESNWLRNLLRLLNPSKKLDMVAGRMMRLGEHEQVDSLGIVFYKSGIASNRKQLDQPLLGPCGGAALYSARMLRRLRDVDGYLFDADFFCYAEDTDLALRARALGYSCAFADDAVVRHHGGHSSGGGYNELIAYYGLRNSVFALTKNLPGGFLARNFHWLLIMQLAVALKYLLKGKPRLVWRIYRDVVRGLPRTLRQRRAALQRHPFGQTAWREFCSTDFYNHAYILNATKTLLRRDILPARNYPPPEI